MRKAGTTIVAACACVALAAPAVASGQSDGWFVDREFPESSWTLDDLGVVDWDGDGDLDVFTTNHLSTQLLMTNDGRGRFEDRLTAARLNQTPSFPGWEDDPNTPSFDEPGLYIYRQSGIVLRLIGPPDQAVGGELRFHAPVTVTQSTDAQLAIRQEAADGQPVRNVAGFLMKGDATVRLRPTSGTLPVDVAIGAGFPLQRVFVGRREVSPQAHGFQVYVRDRHGMAWADYSRDGFIDAFVTRGGVSGNIPNYRRVVRDELLVGNGSTFRDGLGGTGLRKGTCRGRGATATDFNRDDRIDVFFDCLGEHPKLFRQRANGTFKNASGGLRKAGIKGMPFEWIDLDGRGRQELLVTRKRRFAVYRKRRGAWKRVQLLRGRHESNAQKLTVADFDNDGDADVFAASRTGNSLLVNRRNRLRKHNPTRFGLPSRAKTANWVDYDNDGRADIHLIPGGLYRQEGRRRFARTLFAQPGSSVVRAIAAWFDFDANGSRDAVFAVRRQNEGRSTSLRLLENAGPVGRWLQVELTGPPGNRQALGARVCVRTPAVKQTQWVGQSDGSHLSQGHYRLYFGLGGAEGAALEVRWPDGTTQKAGVPANRIVRLTHPG